MRKWEKDLLRAAELFEGVAWPKIKHLWTDAELIPNEDAYAQRKPELDTLSGIDYHIKLANGMMQPIAVRVQDSDKNCYASFTVRKERLGSRHTTELHKRQAELAAEGVQRPYLNCQTYISYSRGEFGMAGVAKQADIIAGYDRGFYRELMNRTEENRPVLFVAVWWESMRAAGLPVQIVLADGWQLHLPKEQLVLF